MVRLDIFIDPICPWCYLGKANLETALARNPDHGFHIEWHPFMLNPDMPLEGIGRRAYLEPKVGGPEAYARGDAMLAERARDAGVVINRFDDQKIPNTLNAHRLVYWAGLEGKQNEVVAALFRANFADGLFLGDTAVLADIAAAEGMDHDVVLRLLNSDADVQGIKDRDAHARKMGITAVPTFIVGNRHAVQGAQPPELWDQVITDLAKQQAEADDATQH